MKRILLCTIACALLLAGSGAFAQTRASLAVVSSAAATSHSAALAYGASTTTGISGYKIYRGDCTGTVDATTHLCSAEATPVIITMVGASTLGYTDTTIAAGAKVYYYVTAYIDSATQTGESLPTNHWAAVVPKDTVPVNAPGTLSGTVN